MKLSLAISAAACLISGASAEFYGLSFPKVLEPGVPFNGTGTQGAGSRSKPTVLQFWLQNKDIYGEPGTGDLGNTFIASFPFAPSR